MQAVTANNDVLQIGDKVRLNSGGPLMTVWAVNDDGSVKCRWQNYNRKLVTENFPALTLTRIVD